MGDGGHLYCESVTILQYKNIAQIFLYMRQTSPFSLYNKSTSISPLPFLIYIFTFCGPAKTITASFFFNIVIRDLCCALFRRWGKSCQRGRPLPPLSNHVISGRSMGAAQLSNPQPRTGARCCVLESRRGGGKSSTCVKQMSSFQRENDGAKSLFRRFEVVILNVIKLID